MDKREGFAPLFAAKNNGRRCCAACDPFEGKSKGRALGADTGTGTKIRNIKTKHPVRFFSHGGLIFVRKCLLSFII